MSPLGKKKWKIWDILCAVVTKGTLAEVAIKEFLHAAVGVIAIAAVLLRLLLGL